MRQRVDLAGRSLGVGRRVAAAFALLALCGFAPASAATGIVLVQGQPGAPGPNVEANIAQLHQRLQITPAQEPAFGAFANIMRENARLMPRTPPPANPNAVEALRLGIQYGQQDLAGMRRLLPALQTLYAALSPAQRRIADQLFRQGPGG